MLFEYIFYIYIEIVEKLTLDCKVDIRVSVTLLGLEPKSRYEKMSLFRAKTLSHWSFISVYRIFDFLLNRITKS